MYYDIPSNGLGITRDVPSMGFPGSSAVMNLPANAGEAGLIPGLGSSPREGNGNPLQYSCLGISWTKGAWWATVHGVTKQLDTTWPLNNKNKYLS